MLKPLGLGNQAGGPWPAYTESYEISICFWYKNGLIGRAVSVEMKRALGYFINLRLGVPAAGCPYGVDSV